MTIGWWQLVGGGNWWVTIGWWQMVGGKSEEEEGEGGADTTLKTETPHVNVVKNISSVNYN